MRKTGIKQFLSGGNFFLESILQKGNSHSAYDLINLKDIHKKFGKMPIDKLKFISETRKFLEHKLLKFETLRPLNYINYNKEKAFEELKIFCGFEYYGRKHLENDLTAFTQLYWFPNKFGVDKRTSHLSSLIVSGQLTRAEALEEYSEPLYDDKMDEIIHRVLDSFGMTRSELDKIMEQPARQHSDYKISHFVKNLRKIKRIIKK